MAIHDTWIISTRNGGGDTQELSAAIAAAFKIK
jgi:hypothetical protein